MDWSSTAIHVYATVSYLIWRDLLDHMISKGNNTSQSLILYFRNPYNTLCLLPKFCTKQLFSNAPGNTAISQVYLEDNNLIIFFNAKFGEQYVGSTWFSLQCF